MSDAIESWPQLFPAPALIEAVGASISTAEKATALARLRRHLKKSRASLAEHDRKFNEMCDKAGRELPIEGLVQLAERVRESEKGAAERLDPWIRALREALAASGSEGQQDIEELIDISVAWLGVYQDTRARLLKIAAERQGGTGEVLRAHPIEGEIDYAKLSREHMARYPKIRAALAK